MHDPGIDYMNLLARVRTKFNWNKKIIITFRYVCIKTSKCTWEILVTNETKM